MATCDEFINGADNASTSIICSVSINAANIALIKSNFDDKKVGYRMD